MANKASFKRARPAAPNQSVLFNWVKELVELTDGVSIGPKEISFDIYQRASEKPIYKILKNLKPKNSNEKFCIKDGHGSVLEKSNNLLSLIEKTRWNNLRAVK